MTHKKYLPYVLLVPTLGYLSVLLLYPLGTAIYWSLHSMNLTRPRTMHNFVGLAHYRGLLGSADFWESVFSTVQYTVFGVAGAFLLAMMLAVLVSRDHRGKTIFRALIISPWPVPYVVVCLIWIWMLSDQFGVVNYLLLRLGLIETAIEWLQKDNLAMFSVVIATIWKEFPFAAMMLLAGLQGIPQDLYDQAAVDGAKPFQIFRYITLPSLRPVSTIVLLLLVIWIFKRFTIIYVMTGGGPGGTTETLIIKTYLTAFHYLKFGKASAVGTMILCITLVFAAIYLWIQEKRKI